MKKSLLLSLLLLLSVITYGQESTLAKISHAVLSMPAFQAEFTVSTPASDGYANSYSGVMTVMGRSYVLSIPQTKICSDGVNIWYYTPGRDEVVIEKVQSGEEVFGSPISLLSLSDEDFAIVSNDEGVITVIPKDEGLASSISKIIMRYDSNTFLPHFVELYSADGSVLNFMFNKISPVNIQDLSIFSFDTSTVKEIIDFR